MGFPWVYSINMPMLSRAIILAVLTLLLCMFTSAAPKPNVLFLAIDDLNTWLLEDPNRYGGEVHAPNLRKLAASGVNFKHAYCAVPKCSPSRTAIFSGVAPWKSGLWENGQDIKKSEIITKVPQLTQHFRGHGYYTAKAGKVTHGYDLREAWDDEIRGVKISRRAAPPAAPLNGLARSKSGKLTEWDWGPTHLKESEMFDALMADYAVEQLGKTHDKPFFIACGLFLPHMPWYVPQKYLDLYPLKDLTLPEFREDDLDDVPPLGRAFANVNAVEKVRAAKQHKKAVQAYLACTSFADAQMGRVLEALERSPYRDNTIVVLWSDHGFHLGEKMHWQKGSLWEEATHSLLMVRAPGVTQPGGTSSAFVSLLDLYPTLVELCGLPSPDHLDGCSFVPQLKSPDAPGRNHTISAFDSQLAVRTATHRYIRYQDGKEELYDRTKDPREYTNLAENEDNAAMKAKLDALLPSPDDMHEGLPFVRKRK